MAALIDCCKIWLQILSKLKQINELLFLLKSSGELRLTDDFSGNRSQLVHLN